MININPTRRKLPRRGSTLLDVALGASLLSLLLIPSMHLMSQSQRNSDRSRNRERLMLEADRIMQSLTVELRDRASLDKAFASSRKDLVKVPMDTIPGCLARILVTPEPTTGTSSTPLVTIQVDVWQDSNSSQSIDANELTQSLTTIQGQW